MSYSNQSGNGRWDDEERYPDANRPQHYMQDTTPYERGRSRRQQSSQRMIPEEMPPRQYSQQQQQQQQQQEDENDARPRVPYRYDDLPPHLRQPLHSDPTSLTSESDEYRDHMSALPPIRRDVEDYDMHLGQFTSATPPNIPSQQHDRTGSDPRSLDQYLSESHVARARARRLSDSGSSLPTAGTTDHDGNLVRMGAAAGGGTAGGTGSSNLKDDTEYDDSFSSSLTPHHHPHETSLTMGAGPRPPPRIPDPQPGLPRPPPSDTVEPACPPLQSNRRWRTKHRRQPDITRGDLSTQRTQTNTEHIVACQRCGRGLRAKKTAVLVKCPVCSNVSIAYSVR